MPFDGRLMDLSMIPQKNAYNHQLFRLFVHISSSPTISHELKPAIDLPTDLNWIWTELKPIDKQNWWKFTMLCCTDCKHKPDQNLYVCIFRCPDEQKRLQLCPEPPLYPMITIKAPVPWKCSIQVAKNRLEQILMVNHPVIRACNMLWHNLYNNLIIVDSASFYAGDVPYHAETITEMIHKSCKITRDVSVGRL